MCKYVVVLLTSLTVIRCMLELKGEFLSFFLVMVYGPFMLLRLKRPMHWSIICPERTSLVDSAWSSLMSFTCLGQVVVQHLRFAHPGISMLISADVYQ